MIRRKSAIRARAEPGPPADLGVREAQLEARTRAVEEREAAVARASAALEARERIADEALRQLRAVNESVLLGALDAHTAAERAEGAQAVAEDARRATELTADELRSANEHKDAFLATLGHELRNPLSPIVAALDVMRGSRATFWSRERGVIDRQVRHMVALVDDLLDLARIASGQLLVHRRPVEIAHVVARAVETAGTELKARQHTLTLDVPREGLAVDGDPTRLAQVVSNLLVNAARYTDPGGHVSVTARMEDDHVCLAVRDDGMGIDAALLPTLFQPFVRGAGANERASAGLGLGLSLVERVVALHDGTVSASSEGPGRGAEIVVRLPRVASSSVRPEATSSSVFRARRRVLVVDDNVDAAEMLAAALESQGHEAALAHSGTAALESVTARWPEVVVLDIGLPGMDGHELARALRALENPNSARPRLWLVATTGYGSADDRQRSADAEIDVHLVKPVSIEALIRTFPILPVP